MPSKNKRAASRQAQLSQRRRRRGGRNRDSVRELRRAPEADHEDTVEAGPATGTAIAAPPAPRPSAAAPTAVREPAEARRRSTRARARAQSEPIQMYPYLAPELKRIGALAFVIAVALGILTVILG